MGFTASPPPRRGLPLNFFRAPLRQSWGVKICIQHQGTRKFLRGVDSWVDSMEAARHFPNSMEALRHCVNNPIGAVNIIIDRGSARTPIIIAVQGSEAASMPASNSQLQVAA